MALHDPARRRRNVGLWSKLTLPAPSQHPLASQSKLAQNAAHTEREITPTDRWRKRCL